MGLIGDLYKLLTDKGFWQRLWDLLQLARDAKKDFGGGAPPPPPAPDPPAPGSGLPDDPEHDPEYWTRHGGG